MERPERVSRTFWVLYAIVAAGCVAAGAASGQWLLAAAPLLLLGLLLAVSVVQGVGVGLLVGLAWLVRLAWRRRTSR